MTNSPMRIAAVAAALAGSWALAGQALAQPRGSHGGSPAAYGQHHGGYGYQGPRRHRGHSIERLLERFDTNKDGKLSQAELDAARKDLLASHDADKDGKLSLEEFATLWLEVMRRRMVRSFQRLDEDGDAVVTLEEFQKPFGTTVETLDRNGDGVLSRDDRRPGKPGSQ